MPQSLNLSCIHKIQQPPVVTKVDRYVIVNRIADDLLSHPCTPSSRAADKPVGDRQSFVEDFRIMVDVLEFRG